MGRAWDAYRRVNASRRPEESVRLRVATLAAVWVGAAAVLATGTAPTLDALVALVGLPVVFAVSYQRRHLDNTFLKFLLSIGAIAVLWRFFAQTRGIISVDDARDPLGALFLSVQLLHGLDLPERKDLGFTLGSSLTLIALAATSATGLWFVLLLGAYVVPATIALMEMQRSRAADLADVDPLAESVAPAVSTPTRPAAIERRRDASTWVSVAQLLLAAALVFAFLPRGSTSATVTLPFRTLASSPLGSALVSAGSGVGGAGGVGIEYFGFAESVDLRTAGDLSDDVVMRVRASAPRFWRGIIFDTYTGSGWTRSDTEPTERRGLPASIPRDGPLPTATRELQQTFTLETGTPNLIFGAGEARAVHIASQNVSVFSDGTITTTQTQNKGTIYSVESVLVDTDPDVLRRTAANPFMPDGFVERWTQLPASVTDRTRALAREVTADTATPYAAAEAIEAWLGDNVEYTLDGPALRRGDVVDTFLFDAQAGWCEPIAASMVVMLRSLGHPARFVTGFQPGERSVFGSSFTVRASMAHAWVEVWVDGEGWIPFDPTGAVPQAVDGSRPNPVPALELLSRLGEALVRTVQRLAVLPGFWPGLIVLSGLACAGVVALRRKRSVALQERQRHDPPLTQLARIVAPLEIEWHAWQTPRELAAAIARRAPRIAGEDVDLLVDAEEALRFSGRAVDRSDVERALANVRLKVAELQADDIGSRSSAR